MTGYLKQFIFRLSSNGGLKKVGINTFWLVFDRVFRMGLGLLIGIWIARYFGPELFGNWNYILAFVALFITLATLGIDGIVVRDLSLFPKKANQILGSIFGLRLVAGIISATFCIVISYFFNYDEKNVFFLINILAITLVLQPFDTADLYFQSVTKSYYTVISKGAALLLVSALKIFLLLNAFPIIYFVWANVLEVLLSSIFLIMALSNVNIKIAQWKWANEIAKKIFKEGWPLIISGMLVMIYLKIDQVMLKEMAGEKSVGIYSAAVRLSEIWYFIPVIICSSILPYLIRQRETSKEKYLLTLKRIYSLFTYMALFIAIGVMLSSSFLITLIFGIDYEAAADVLSIHVWAGIFVFLGVASSQFLLAENIMKISMYRTLIGATTNIVLNLILIPDYQEIGAAYATLVSYFVSTFSLIIFKSCREQCLFMVQGLFPGKKLFL